MPKDATCSLWGMSKDKCTREAVDKAVGLKQSGVSDKDIAAALCVHPSTFSTWVNHPRTDNQRKLSKALKKAESDYKAYLLKLIRKQAAERDWKAAAWLLERKYPQEFARCERKPEPRPEDVPDVPTFTFDEGDA